MQTTRFFVLTLLAGSLSTGLLPAAEHELKPIELPPPQTTGGKPLMDALRERHTTRELKTNDLPSQLLANLLWAGFGINRPATGQRTAPSAMNSQEVDLYVARRDGLYLYEARPHRLVPILPGDFRARTSGSPFATNAPVVLIYVADLSRLSKAKPEDRPFYAGVDTGFISQNLYLACASEGLGTVVYAVNASSLSEALKLGPNQKAILAQAVGYPKD